MNLICREICNTVTFHAKTFLYFTHGEIVEETANQKSELKLSCILGMTPQSRPDVYHRRFLQNFAKTVYLERFGRSRVIF